MVVSGNVFNDIGGLVTNANVNGAGIGLPSGTQVYAYLSTPGRQNFTTESC